MPENSEAKARALRIPLDFHRGDRLAWYRNVLTIAAVTICIGWLLAGHFGPQSLAERYSPGPVSNPHAHLSCEDCHHGNAPLRDRTFLSGWKLTRTPEQEIWHRPTDTMCKSCHPVVGSTSSASEMAGLINSKIVQPIPIAAHSENQKIESVDSCASCHREHQAADRILSQVADSSCIKCHRKLEDHRRSPEQGIETQITRFDKDHPVFRSLEKDPGTLKFNHALHLSTGIREPGSRVSSTKTLKDYPDHVGRLDRQTDNDGQIALTCRYCHEPQQGTPSQPRLLDDGSYSTVRASMSMPTYEGHCRVCHSIDVPSRPDLGFINKLKVEHGIPPHKLADALLAYFSLEVIAPPELRAEVSNQAREMLSEVPTRLWDIQDSETKVGDEVRVHFAEAATKIRTSCLFCHFASHDDTGQGLPIIARQPLAQSGVSNQVFETHWFKHALFDHLAHRDVDCVHCHQNSGGKGDLLSNNKDLSLDRPMIKDYDSCLECHRTAGDRLAHGRPGPVNCTACHTYHGGGNRANAVKK